VENFHLRHSKEIVQQLERIVQEEGIEHIFLAGDEVILSVLRKQLPPSLAGKVVDELKLDITAPEHEILSATLAAMSEQDAQTDAALVRAIIDEYRSGGLAVIGVHDVLAALANGQVNTVFLSAGLEQLHSSEEEGLHEALAPELKELPQGTGIRITDAIVTRAQQTGAQVRFIEDPALLAHVGGVGAALRYGL
jgi:peptide subunit release factor 1 (eRF1)